MWLEYVTVSYHHTEVRLENTQLGGEFIGVRLFRLEYVEMISSAPKKTAFSTI